MSDALPYQPSLATATNTRVETAARHMQQCRVSFDDMVMFVQDQAIELQRQKYRYCVHKDELVLGIGRPWSRGHAVRRSTANLAYPPVVSNLGDLDNAYDGLGVKMIRYMNHNATTLRRRKEIIEFFKRDAYRPPAGGAKPFFEERGAGKLGTQMLLKMMYDFHPVGVANTLGWAHPNTGDNITAVMVGGQRTVQNGDWEIWAGDEVQFYWCFERDDFDAEGKRKPPAISAEANTDPAGSGLLLQSEEEQRRQLFHDRQYSANNGHNKQKKIVAKIKPYVEDEDHPRVYDRLRVIGIATSHSRPNDMVDIKIQRQSM